MIDDPGTDKPPRQEIAAERDAYAAGRDQNVTVHHHYGQQPRARSVRLRVLVSWTSDDLQDHREQVRRALRRLGVEEVESGPGARPLADHLNEVRGCDLFLGVFAWRYGPIPEGHSRSLPELELRAAQEAGVPCLLFLLSDRVPWPPGAMDRGEAGQRIDGLRDELAAGADCEHFTNAADLGARVEELVGPRTLGDETTSHTGSEMAVPWRAYRQRLVEEYGRLDLEALTPPEREEYLQLWLRDVFVEPDVRQDAPPVELPKELWRKLQAATELSSSDVPRGLDREDLEQARRVYRTRPRRAVFDVVARPAERLCVLLGDPGAGKSTIARYLALALAQDRLPERLAELDAHQPVLIELRDYAVARARAHCADFGEYLAHRARTDGLGLPREAMERYLTRGGPALVIFDGLDELFDPREREAVAREIAWFASSRPTARVLVTSRIVGYRRRILAEAGFTHYTVQDLVGDQIQEFLTSWFELALHDRPVMAEQRLQRLTRAIDDSSPIRELAGNPLLLTILAIIGKHRELPRERWKVYDHAAGVLVEHWDVNKHLSDARVDADVIREDDKKDLLRRLAYRMQLGTEGLAGNHIWMDDLVEEVVGYLRGRFQYDLAHATAIANTIVAQFHERNFVLARYGPRVYGFVHRALLEFFCAGEIVGRFEKTRALTEAQLCGEVFEAHWEDPAWTEVLRLIAGMVDATVTDRLLERLLRRARPVRTTALDQPPLGAVTLAVQCLAEVRSLGSAERSARLVLEAIIDLLQAPDRSFADDRRDRLEKAILPAVAAVGPTWPGRDRFLSWFLELSTTFVTWRACRVAPRVLAALYSDTPSVRTMLMGVARHDGLREQRRACLLAVTDRWPDLPETHALVTGLLHDHAATIRQTAIEQLAANWSREPGTRLAVHEAILDADARVRQVAVEQLAARWPHDPETPVAVIGRLDDPHRDVREAALEQLTANWATRPGTLTAVHRAAEDPAWSVRRAALRALDASWAHTPETLAVLRHAAADADEDVRQTAIQALADRWADDPGTQPTVLAAVADAAPQVGVAAVEQLVNRWPDSPETGAALHRACRSSYGDVQCAALAASSRHAGGGTEDPLGALLARLADAPNEDVRRAAVEVVASHRSENPEILQAVLRATNDPEHTVRIAAMRMLERHWPGHLELRGACLAGVREHDYDVRSTAVELLALHWGDDPDLFPVFLTSARDRYWMVRRVALGVLAARWTSRPEAVAAIRGLATDSVGLLRETALEALAAIGDDRERAIRGLSDPHRGMRRTARNLLAKGWRESWTDRERLTEALDSEEPRVRETALGALVERFGSDPATWTAVERALDDNEPDLRLLALEALLAGRRSEGPTKASVLTAIRDPDADVRRLALQALLVRWPLEAATGDAVRRLVRDPDPEVTRMALETLALSAPDDPATFEALALGCAHPDLEVRKPALEALAAHRPGHPDAAAKVLDASDDSDAGVRLDCLQALSLRWREAEGVLARIRRAALDPNTDVRRGALEALISYWSDHAGTAKPVAGFRWDGDPRTRRMAYEGLAFLGMDETGSLPLDLPAAAAAVAHPDARDRVMGLTRLLLAWPEAPETRRAVRIGMQDRVWHVHNIANADLIRRAPDDPDALAALKSVGIRSLTERVREVALWGTVHALPNHLSSRSAVERAFDDPHWDVRDTAVDLLVKFWADDDTCVRLLRRMTADQDARVRVTSLNWLASIHPQAPETLPTLVRLTRDPDGDVREAALGALLALWPGAPETVTALHAASRGFHNQTRANAREALDRRARGHLRSCDETVRVAAQGHPTQRVDAIEELAMRWPDAPETLELLQSCAVADNEFVRQGATRILAEAWPRIPGLPAMALRAVQDGNAIVRRYAVTALSDVLHPDDAFAAVAAAITDRHWAVRTNAMHRLMTRWPERKETLALLREATGDPDWYVRLMAHNLLHLRVRDHNENHWAITCDPHPYTHHALRRLLLSGPHPLPITPPDLLPLWRDDAEARARATLLTAPMRGDVPDLRPVLAEIALGEDHAVHETALETLAIWWPDDTETLDTLISGTGHPCPRVRGFAHEALYVRPDQRQTARRLARKALDDPAAPIRMGAAEFLQVDGPLDAPALLRLTTDPDEDIAKLAIESLGLQEPADPEVREKLREAVHAFPEPGPRYWFEWHLRVSSHI